jgi:segregation and condensation protein A
MTLEVRLEKLDFAGPLDLLLTLVRRNEMDLAAIDVSVICDQFVTYIEEHRLSELEEGYSFLLLASTLLEIKSRMLLPVSLQTDNPDAPAPEEERSAEEMTRELVHRLTVYASFESIAKEFEKRLSEMNRYLPGGVRREFENQHIVSMKDVSLFDLMSTFQRVLTERRSSIVEISDDVRPIEEAMEDLLNDPMIVAGGRDLAEMLNARPSVLDLVVTFLAILELIAAGKFDFIVSDGKVMIIAG